MNVTHYSINYFNKKCSLKYLCEHQISLTEKDVQFLILYNNINVNYNSNYKLKQLVYRFKDWA